ncbi:MAG: glycosyltransferase [Nanoarchaeota archaeon]|nr:glycosyltransferase [Nanoarchaeota archaeon]
MREKKDNRKKERVHSKTRRPKKTIKGLKEDMLTNTTLAMIVKNEMNTFGGGIQSFVSSQFPFVEKIVIVDTGSTDGTKEYLESLKTEFQNLEVHSRAFDDFASSRNHALSKVKTSRVLILDADERLSPEEYEYISQEVKDNPHQGYLFSVDNILKNGEIQEYLGPLNPRLFTLIKGVKFVNTMSRCAEELEYNGKRFSQAFKLYSIGTTIQHFYTPKKYP